MPAGLGMSTGDDDLSACHSPGDLSFSTAMSPTISDPFVVEDNYLVDLYHAYASTQPPESIRSSTETTSDGSTAASYYTTRDIKLNAYVRDIPVVAGDSSGTHLTVSGDAVANQLYTPPPSPLRHIPIADLEDSSPHSTSGAAPSDTAQNTAASEPSVMPRFFHMKWNDYFQRMLELPEETQEEQVRKCVWISTIAKDFTYTAKVIAKTIIREYHIDPLLKTIKPIDVGGQAGGPKYVWHDIIFKFAVDWKKIYRGDEFAQKAASHELKSAMRYYRLDPQLRIPLLALIDYRGHRMIAESILPLSHQTIRYGSNDGGKTIHNSDSQLAKIMRKCSRKLNIAGHQVANKHLHGPFDIEGHLGTDGHYYLVDFARIFPPVYEPRIDIKHTYLYHLFRPEFLKNYPIPLSSDAFSLMAAEPSLECNQQVVVASDYLREGVIPRFARYLEALEDVNLKTIEEQLTELVHREGINIRYLGRVRSELKRKDLPELSRILLNEMCARIIKNHLKRKLRDRVEQQAYGDHMFTVTVMNYLNFVLGQAKDPADDFWKKQEGIKFELSRRFRGSLSAREMLSTFDLRPLISMAKLLRRVGQLTGVRITKKAWEELDQQPDTFRLVSSDVKKVSARVKQMNIIALAEANELSIRSYDFLSNPRGSQRLFNLAMHKFEMCIRSTPDSEDALISYGDELLRHSLKPGVPAHITSEYLQKALEKFKMARNFDGLVRLGATLTRLHTERWEEHDEFLSLASMCYQQLSLFHVSPQSPAPEGVCSRCHLKGVDVPVVVVSQSSVPICRGCSIPLVGSSLSFAPGHLKGSCEPDGEYQQSNEEIAAYGLQQWAKVLREKARRRKDLSVYAEAGRKFKRAIECFPHSYPPFLQQRLDLEDKEFALLLDAFVCDPSMNSFDAGAIIFTEQITNGFLLLLSECCQLRSIDLSRCTHIHEETFDDISAGSPLLEALTLDHCAANVSDATIECLARSCSNLSSLSLVGCTKITDAALGFMGNLPNLNHLDLSACTRVGDEGVRTMIISIHNHAVLASIAFSETELFTSLGFGMLVGNFPGLRSISCQRCVNVTSSAPNNAIEHIVSRNAQLERLDLAGCSFVTAASLTGLFESGACRNLSYLDLSLFVGLDDAVLRCIASHRGATLRTLSLIGCDKLTDSSISLVAEQCTGLTSLDLSRCLRVTDDPLNLLVRNAPLLTFLNASQCKVSNNLLLALAGVGSIASLILNNCSKSGSESLITDDGVLELAQHCPRIIRLELSSSKISDRSLAAIGKHLPYLRTLVLQRMILVSDKGLLHLADGCHLLEILDLSATQGISNVGPLAVGCPILSWCSLWKCMHITSDAIVQLSAAVTLKYLNITECKRVGDEALEAVRANCHSLTELFYGGNKFSNGAVAFFNQHKPAVLRNGNPRTPQHSSDWRHTVQHSLFSSPR